MQLYMCHSLKVNILHCIYIYSKLQVITISESSGIQLLDFDSWGRVGSGRLHGHSKYPGYFDQCILFSSPLLPEIKTKYCTASITFVGSAKLLLIPLKLVFHNFSTNIINLTYCKKWFWKFYYIIDVIIINLLLLIYYY